MLLIDNRSRATAAAAGSLTDVQRGDVKAMFAGLLGPPERAQAGGDDCNTDGFPGRQPAP